MHSSERKKHNKSDTSSKSDASTSSEKSSESNKSKSTSTSASKSGSGSKSGSESESEYDVSLSEPEIAPKSDKIKFKVKSKTADCSSDYENEVELIDERSIKSSSKKNKLLSLHASDFMNSAKDTSKQPKSNKSSKNKLVSLRASDFMNSAKDTSKQSKQSKQSKSNKSSKKSKVSSMSEFSDDICVNSKKSESGSNSDSDDRITISARKSNKKKSDKKSESESSYDVTISAKKSIKANSDKKPKSSSGSSSGSGSDSSSDSSSNSESTTESEPMSDTKHDKKETFENLVKFMSKFRIQKSATGEKIPDNYRVMESPFGSYNIPDDYINKFFELYTEAVYSGCNVTVVEVHREQGPIVIDLDFVQAKENSERYYNKDLIVSCVTIYNGIIKSYLNVTDIELTSYITEKEKPSFRKGEYHDGIHIMYPFICTTPSLQILMRKKFIAILGKKNLFKDLPYKNSLDDIVDIAPIYRNGWLLYGSRKQSDIKGNLYELTQIYEVVTNKNSMTLVEVLEPNERKGFSKDTINWLIKKMSIRKYRHKQDLTEHADDIDPTKLDDSIIKIAKEKGESFTKKYVGEEIAFTKATTEQGLAEARNLLKLFSLERATAYKYWYQIGRCLHNIDYRLLRDWIEFSKRCPEKYKEGECVKYWRKFKLTNDTMATLHFFAARDSPEKYAKLQEANICEYAKKAELATHYNIAKLLMEKYKFRFKCGSIKHRIWYEFKNHRWQKMDSANTLQILISEEIPPIFEAMRRRLQHQAADANGDRSQKLLDKAKKTNDIIKSLGDDTFKTKIINQCAYLAHDPLFLANLDENRNLICFENGVYDLESGFFRDGCPDDCISFSTGYDYIEYDKNDEYAKAINDFVEKIQPNKVLRDYLMTLLSTCLAGSIREESFYVFTGSGANGKSKLMELLKLTLGNYYKPMDVRLLTEKRSNSAAASPEVADKKGIRACTLDEPNANDEINTGFMKLFTGGDEITARALYQDPVYFKPQFKPFLLCNKLPNIRADDEGTWRRLKVLHFESKFIKEFEATKAQKKLIAGGKSPMFYANIDISEKLPEWKQTFMAILLNYYQKYLKNGLVHPKLVLKYTNEYKKRCDVYQDFMGDCLVKTGEDKHELGMMNVHDLMKRWYKSNYDGKCPNQKELRLYIKNRTDSYNEKTDSLRGYEVNKLSATGTHDKLGNIG